MHKSSLKQSDINDRKKQLTLELSPEKSNAMGEKPHINISNVVHTFEENNRFAQCNNDRENNNESKSINNTTRFHPHESSSAAFYYDITTPKSPHDESLLMYEVDTHSMADQSDDVDEKAMEREKLNRALLEEQDRLEQELKEREEKQVMFQVSKKEILNNIHLFMTMKYKENQMLKKSLETVNQNINLLEKLHQAKNLNLLSPNETNPVTDGAPQNVSSLKHTSTNQDQQAGLNQHHRRNYTNTCPTRNSGIVGKTSEGVPVFKRFDGIMIIIKCVTCGREGFTSPQGIVNHARLKHSKLYSSQQLAILNNQKLLPIQSQKILTKFKELKKDPNNDFLPLVAISLYPISIADSGKDLDRKLMLVEEKSSLPTQQKSMTSTHIQKHFSGKVETELPINNKSVLQQPKPLVSLRHLSNFQKNKESRSKENMEQSGNYDLINETVDFLKKFKPKSAIPSSQTTEGHFESSVSSFPSASATPNSDKSVPRSTASYIDEPETKKRKTVHGENGYLNYIKNDIKTQTSAKDLDQKPTLGSTFYNLRSRKRSSIPSKKWEDFVLYQ